MRGALSRGVQRYAPPHVNADLVEKSKVGRAATALGLLQFIRKRFTVPVGETEINRIVNQKDAKATSRHTYRPYA